MKKPPLVEESYIEQTRKWRDSPLQFLIENFIKYGDVYRIKPSGCYVFVHPDQLNELLVVKYSNYPQFGLKQEDSVKRKFLGKGVGGVDPESWRCVKKAMAPLFEINALLKHVPTIFSNAQKFELLKELTFGINSGDDLKKSEP